MNTKLTEKEMQALAGYERELQAAKDDYLRSMGRQGGTLLHEIYHRVTGEHFQRTDTCGHCELRLQKTVAGWYFATKAAAEAAKEPVEECDENTVPKPKKSTKKTAKK